MIPNCFFRLLNKFRQWKKSPRLITEFDYLPPHIFLKILRYLPFPEQVRIGRVNRLFYEISITAIKNTKEFELCIDKEIVDFLHLSSELYQYAKSLANLFQLCSSNLEKMSLIGISNRHLLNLLRRFKYPRLTMIRVHISSFVHKNRFGQFMMSNRNLKVVVWCDEYAFPSFNFTDRFVCENLTILFLHMVNGETLRSLTGRCPNLKHFAIRKIYPDVSAEYFDDFFDGCPKLELFQIANDTTLYQFRWSTQLVHFWNLESMRDLKIGREAVGDYPFNDFDLRMIATSFPRLENLRLSWYVNAASYGIAALTSLKKLNHVRFTLCGDHHDFDENFDLTIRKFVKCDQLQVLSINVTITATTLILLVQRLRQLRELILSQVTHVSTIEEAITVARCFDGYVNRDISIHFYQNSLIRLSDEVATILQEIRTNRFAIKFEAIDYVG